MKSKYKVYTYDELIQAKINLKKDIKAQELSVQNSLSFKFASNLFSRNENLKNSIAAAIPSLKVKNLISSPMGNMLTTVLMANKFTRKYFVSIAMASQLLPFLIEKVDDLVHRKDESKGI